jgi:hypothetical protein
MPDSDSRLGLSLRTRDEALALVKAGRVREVAMLEENDKEERIAEMMDGYDPGEHQPASASDVALGIIEEAKTLVAPEEPTFENADHLEANLNTLILNSNAARAANRPQHLQDHELERQRRISEQVVAVVRDEPASPDIDEPDVMEVDEPESFYTDEAGVVWKLKEDNSWEEQFQSEQVDDEPEDQWPSGYLDEGDYSNAA